MTVWTDFAGELLTAAIAAVAADSVVGVGGSLGVAEVEEATAASGEIIYHPSRLPAVGLAPVSAVPKDTGPLDEVEVKLTALCVAGPTEELTLEDARALAIAMGARVVKVLKGWHGQKPGASAHSVLVRAVDTDEASVDEDEMAYSVAASVTLGALHYGG